MHCFYFLVQSSSKPGPALEAEKVAGVVSCCVGLANIVILIFNLTKILWDVYLKVTLGAIKLSSMANFDLKV